MIEPFSVLAERIRNAPAPAPLIPGLIDAGRTYCFFGDPRCGKTSFAEDVAVSGATGTAVAGYFPVPEPVKVAYYSKEDSARDVYDRMARLLRSRGIEDDPERLYVDIAYDIDLDDPAHCARLIDEVRERAFQIVIFDPLQALSGRIGGSATEFRPVGLFFRNLAALGCAVIVVHHTAKPSSDGRESRSFAYRASGGGIFATTDCPIFFKKRSDTEFIAIPDQWKHSATPEPFGLTLNVEPGLYRLVAGTAHVKSAALVKSPREAITDEKDEAICGALAAAPNGLLNADLRRAGIDSKTLSARLPILEKAGRISKRDRRFYLSRPSDVAA